LCDINLHNISLQKGWVFPLSD